MPKIQLIFKVKKIGDLKQWRFLFAFIYFLLSGNPCYSLNDIWANPIHQNDLVQISDEYQLSYLTVPCEESIFQMIVSANVNLANIQGYELSLTYHSGSVSPTGSIEVLQNAISDASVVMSSYIIEPQTSTTSKITFSLNTDTTLQSPIYWNSNLPVDLFEIEFEKTAAFNNQEELLFNLELEEDNSIGDSFVYNNIIGGLTTEINDELYASLNFWLGYEPIPYNQNVTEEYAITKIYSTNSSCTISSSNYISPNLLGAISLSNDLGDHIRIERDIANHIE